jgi:hypothetical protein
MRRRAARPIWPLAIAGIMTRRAMTPAERDVFKRDWREYLKRQSPNA